MRRLSASTASGSWRLRTSVSTIDKPTEIGKLNNECTLYAILVTSLLSSVNEVLLKYQQAVYKKQIKGPDVDHQWSFSGAFLYSLTVITTIGYGNITPSSDWGKLVTILYAIIGMPLFLLYLSNIGMNIAIGKLLWLCYSYVMVMLWVG